MSLRISASRQPAHGRSIATDRPLLRLSATLLFVGFLLFALAGYFHNLVDAQAPANTHSAAFEVYAASGNWMAIHLGQFVGTAVMLAGLLILFFALNVSGGVARWLGFFGAISAGVTLALAGVVYAVDGVALKQAVDAWASAPATEKTARFASAEVIRWLEWGTKGYQDFMIGLALLLFALAIVRTARVPRPIGYLMGAAGLAYLLQGWVLGTEGFSSTTTYPTLLGYILVLAWIVWLFIVAWRMKEPLQQAAPA